MKNRRSRILLLIGLSGLLTLASAQQPLTPQDDWVAAIRAGGSVTLGPGAFHTTEFVELAQSVTVRGQGMGATSLWFASDGGSYGEHLVLLGGESGTTRYEFSDMDISNDSVVSADLIVLWGDTHLTLRRVSVNLAYDADYASGASDAWRGSGLLIGEDASALVDNCVFYANTANGIAAMTAERLVVQNCSFYENGWAGIYVVDTPLTASRNYFEMNDVGIEIYGDETRVLSLNTYRDQYTMDVYEQ